LLHLVGDLFSCTMMHGLTNLPSSVLCNIVLTVKFTGKG